ncbi:MAG: tetratricopeptide repeat protein [Phycisphaerae bacterium]|nr:tetratricopeptide repeat protein [Phycisphaerae bacterium]
MLRKKITTAVIIICLCSISCESNSANKQPLKASVEAKLNLAQQEYDNNYTDEAMSIVSECINTDPDNAQAHLLYGKLLLTDDKATDAARELQLAVELEENLEQGWYWLGLAAEGQGQTQQSLFCYNKALSLNPANIDYILAVAETYAKQEKLEEAITLLEEKITAMPKEIPLKTAAADLMWRLGENEQAIELYEQVMLMTGDDNSVVESLGYCYVFSGQWNEGAEIFNKLIGQCEDEQKKKSYLQAAAFCSVNSAQYDKAVNCYNELSVEERDNAEFWVKMGQASLGAGAADRALMCGQRALALQPGDADATVLIGCAQYSMADYNTAIKNFEKVNSDAKNSNISQLMTARCYERLGRKGEAERIYKKALEVEPNSKLGNFMAKEKDVGAW